MRKSMFVASLLAGLTMPLPVRAQERAPLDSAQQAAMRAAAMQINKPAEFVLLLRADLGLTTAQVAALEPLVLAQRDSAAARQARVVSRTLANYSSGALLVAGSWTGEIDESALRDAMCQQGIGSLDVMLGLARDRRAVAALLTAEQVEQLPLLQAFYLTNARRP